MMDPADRKAILGGLADIATWGEQTALNTDDVGEKLDRIIELLEVIAGEE